MYMYMYMYVDECMIHTHLSCPVSFYGHATPQGRTKSQITCSFRRGYVYRKASSAFEPSSASVALHCTSLFTHWLLPLTALHHTLASATHCTAPRCSHTGFCHSLHCTPLFTHWLLPLTALHLAVHTLASATHCTAPRCSHTGFCHSLHCTSLFTHWFLPLIDALVSGHANLTE